MCVLGNTGLPLHVDERLLTVWTVRHALAPCAPQSVLHGVVAFGRRRSEPLSENRHRKVIFFCFEQFLCPFF
jgi:hypothetical protein